MNSLSFKAGGGGGGGGKRESQEFKETFRKSRERLKEKTVLEHHQTAPDALEWATQVGGQLFGV